MESFIVGAKGQVVIPKKIRAMFHIKIGTGGKALKGLLEEKKQERAL